MTKTVIIPDDIHMLIIKKQVFIRENYKINPRITDMLVVYIKAGLDRTEELLNIKVEKSKKKEDSGETKILLVREDDVKTR